MLILNRFNSKFYEKTGCLAIIRSASSSTAEVYKQIQEQSLIYTALSLNISSTIPYTLQMFGNDFLMTSIPLLDVHTCTTSSITFYHINNLRQNIKFTIEQESNG